MRCRRMGGTGRLVGWRVPAVVLATLALVAVACVDEPGPPPKPTLNDDWPGVGIGGQNQDGHTEYRSSSGTNGEWFATGQMVIDLDENQVLTARTDVHRWAGSGDNTIAGTQVLEPTFYAPPFAGGGMGRPRAVSGPHLGDEVLLVGPSTLGGSDNQLFVLDDATWVVAGMLEFPPQESIVAFSDHHVVFRGHTVGAPFHVLDLTRTGNSITVSQGATFQPPAFWEDTGLTNGPIGGTIVGDVFVGTAGSWDPDDRQAAVFTAELAPGTAVVHEGDTLQVSGYSLRSVSADLDGDELRVAMALTGDNDSFVQIERQDGEQGWVLEATLRLPSDLPDVADGVMFPNSVALDGDLLVIGERGIELPGTAMVGTRYSAVISAFERDEVGSWHHVASLLPGPDGVTGSDEGARTLDGLSAAGGHVVATANAWINDAGDVPYGVGTWGEIWYFTRPG